MAGLPGKTVALGNPQSSTHQVSQPELADWMTEIEGLTGLSGFAFVRGSAAALSGLGSSGQYALVVTTAADRGIYERGASVWTKVAALPLILTESLAADQAEADRILAQAAAVSAEGDADAAAASATAAATSQSLADVARTQAQLAAVAAGATLYASVAAGEAGTVNGDVFLLSTEPGVQVYENDTGTGVFLGWLGEVLLDDVTAVLAWTPPAYPQTGLILRTRKDGFAYTILASGATDQDLTTAGGVKLTVLPSLGKVSLDAWGAPTGNDAAVFAKALKVASDARCQLIGWEDQTITFVAPLDVTGVEHLDVLIPGARFQCNGVGAGQTGLRISNSFNYLSTSVTAPLVGGDSTISVASTAGVQVGDIVVLTSTEVYNPQRPDAFFVVNMLRVRAVGASTVDVEGEVYNDFNTATFTVTASFTKPITGRGVEGIAFSGEGNANSNGFEIIGGIGLEVLNCEVSGFKDSGMKITRGFQSGFYKCITRGINDTVLGYGLYLSSSHRGYIRNCVGYGNRHSMECGGASEDCIIEGCRAENDISFGIASHGNARRVSFRRNVVVNCVGGIISRGIEPTIEGNRVVKGQITGATVLIKVGEASGVNRSGLAGINARVLHNIVVANGESTIGLHFDTTTRSAIVQDNIFIGNFGGNNIMLMNGETFDGGSVIASNSFRRAVSTGDSAAVSISPFVADKIDATIKDVRQTSCRWGIRVIEPAGSTGVSRVEIRDCDLRNNTDRPVIVNGKYDTVFLAGLVMKNNSNPNGQRPADADIGTLLTYGVSGTFVEATAL